jgi:hypothetical protein
MKTNRHPVDELGDIRAERAALEAREARARTQVKNLMEAGGRLSGDEYVAEWEVRYRKGQIDPAALRRAGLKPDKFRKPSRKVDVILTDRRSEVGGK